MLLTMISLSRSDLKMAHKMLLIYSPEIVSLLFNIMGNMVGKTITENIKKAGQFSILADESNGASKKEQLAIVLRSVDEEGVLHEHLWKL